MGAALEAPRHQGTALERTNHIRCGLNADGSKAEFVLQMHKATILLQTGPEQIGTRKIAKET